MATITIRYTGNTLKHQVITFCKKCGKQGISVTLERWTNGHGGSHRADELREELRKEADKVKSEGSVCQLCTAGGAIDPVRFKQALQLAFAAAENLPVEKCVKHDYRRGPLLTTCRQKKIIAAALDELGIGYIEGKVWGQQYIKVRLKGAQTDAECAAFAESLIASGFENVANRYASGIWEARPKEYTD